MELERTISVVFGFSGSLFLAPSWISDEFKKRIYSIPASLFYADNRTLVDKEWEL